MNQHEHGHAEHELAAYRAAKDAYMRDDLHSPLEHEDRHHFEGLAYYPANADLRLVLALDRDVSPEPVPVDTSTGESQELQRAGKVRFEVEGKAAELTIFRSPDGGLFLPLRDATSGDETYGAGRYLEPELLEDGWVLVDFNYLYNPFCAYSDAWTCPLPPRENWLRVPVRAGEKTFRNEK